MSNDTWEFTEEFETDPSTRGWVTVGSGVAWDNGEEAIGGDLGQANGHMYKFVSSKTLDDDWEFLLTGYSPDSGSDSGFVGLHKDTDVDTANFLGIKLNNNIRLMWTASDGTLVTGAGIALTDDVVYQLLVQYDSLTRTLSLEVYDTDNNPIGNDAVQITAGKTITIDRFGLWGDNSASVYEFWLQTVKMFPSSLLWGDLYCSPYEMQDLLSILDQTVDLTERQSRMIIKLLAMPKIDSFMSAIGYAVPFDTGDSTPPIIRALAIKLSTYYALKKLYTGHSPNEIKHVYNFLKEVMDEFRRLADCLCADMNIVDTDGNVIEPTLIGDSGGVMSTSAGEENVFDLEDVPDIFGEDAGLFVEDGG